MPFRTAHELVGAMVRRLLDEQRGSSRSRHRSSAAWRSLRRRCARARERGGVGRRQTHTSVDCTRGELRSSWLMSEDGCARVCLPSPSRRGAPPTSIRSARFRPPAGRMPKRLRVRRCRTRREARGHLPQRRAAQAEPPRPSVGSATRSRSLPLSADCSQRILRRDSRSSPAKNST